jgi:hypothetical protein
MEQLDLHFYDHKISGASLLTTDYNVEKLEQGFNRISPMVPPDKPNILHNLLIIINEYRCRGREKNSCNYDQSNDCYACELLSICFDILFKGDRTEEDFSLLLSLFLEQIDDMSTGLCPPGRTTRLVQFVLSTTVMADNN